MANPYFQFKQFTVYHDQCAMKVGTDGVLLGAWCNLANSHKALDVGTGTGLIALMLAQRNQSLLIQAIDTDSCAISQAISNTNLSPFANQISCEHLSLQDFDTRYPNNKYDHIVSNPPFFVSSLRSPDIQRTTARHTDSLDMDDLILIASRHLSEKGKISLIYPHHEKDNLLEVVNKYKLYTSRITHVHPTPSHPAKRILIEISNYDTPLSETSITIEESRHIYTPEFSSLVRDFYLRM